jgi:hypothetical protein
MLRIRRLEEDGSTSFALSGRIEQEQVLELKTLLEGEAEVSGITLDLKEVRLVAREAVRFLAECESRGIKLKNSPSYVREWIDQGGNKS